MTPTQGNAAMDVNGVSTASSPKNAQAAPEKAERDGGGGFAALLRPTTPGGASSASMTETLMQGLERSRQARREDADRPKAREEDDRPSESGAAKREDDHPGDEDAGETNAEDVGERSAASEETPSRVRRSSPSGRDALAAAQSPREALEDKKPSLERVAVATPPPSAKAAKTPAVSGTTLETGAAPGQNAEGGAESSIRQGTASPERRAVQTGAAPQSDTARAPAQDRVAHAQKTHAQPAGKQTANAQQSEGLAKSFDGEAKVVVTTATPQPRRRAVSNQTPRSQPDAVNRGHGPGAQVQGAETRASDQNANYYESNAQKPQSAPQAKPQPDAAPQQHAQERRAQGGDAQGQRTLQRPSETLAATQTEGRPDPHPRDRAGAPSARGDQPPARTRGQSAPQTSGQGAAAVLTEPRESQGGRKTAFAQPARTSADAPAQKPVDQVLVRIRQDAAKGDSIKIRLRPEALGAVEVKLAIKNGKVNATVITETRDAFEMMKADARGLERALNDAGLKTDAGSLNFQMQGGPGSQTAGREGGAQGQKGPGTPYDQSAQALEDDLETMDIETIRQARADARGGVDVRI